MKLKGINSFERIYLIGLDTWYTNSPQTPFTVQKASKFESEYSRIVPNDYGQVALGKSRDADLISYLEFEDHQIPVSAQAIYKNDIPVPKDWSDKVATSFLHTIENIDYFTWQIFIQLSPNSLKNSLVDYHWHNTHAHDRLFDTLLPKCEGERIKFADNRPRFKSIIYFEPKNSLLTDREGIQDIVTELLSFFDKKVEWFERYLLLDIVLTPDVTFGASDEKIIAVQLTPLPRRAESNSVCLPHTVLQLAQYMNHLTQLQHLVLRLKRLTFYDKPIREYLNDFKKAANISTSYHYQFLTDRENELSERSRIDQMAHAIAREIKKNNYISGFEGTSAYFPLKFKNHKTIPFRVDNLNIIVDALKKRRSDTLEEIRRVSRLIRSKTDALSEYLRDAAISEATLSNISLQKSNNSLQKSIRTLTFFAVLITLIALFIGIIGVLPDEMKRTLVRELQTLMQ